MRVKFEKIVKYHEWFLCKMSRTNHAISIGNSMFGSDIWHKHHK